MFCNQCQETLKNQGCTKVGVCGKKGNVASLQDVLIFVTEGLGIILKEINDKNLFTKYGKTLTTNLFMTITNANFDPEKIVKQINKTIDAQNELKISITNLNDLQINVKKGDEKDFEQYYDLASHLVEKNDDIRSLKEIILYGLKGMAAYTNHAQVLDFESTEIYEFISQALTKISKKDISQDELIKLIIETGNYGVKAMALLDQANTSTYGHPEITKVSIETGEKPGILISGHDLKDLEQLLEQSKDQGIEIYTHSEMLPAHYYPKFKKYKHFKGNYGNAWWKQKEEFESFNGPILMTTNCIVPSKKNYISKMFTTGAAGFPGAKHIEEVNGEKDFSEIIELAKISNPPINIEKGEIVGGFAHNQVLALKDKILEEINNGNLKKFVVMAGCDGRMKNREYYTEFASNLSKDWVILTAGCAKYRYNKLDLGDINGIPRVLDAGQCNDSYSLAFIALQLKEILKLEDINDLPIVYNIAWYEQKAVIVLLSLLALGVKNIHLGPTLPGFLTPNTAKFIVDTFKLSGIENPENDLEIFKNM